MLWITKLDSRPEYEHIKFAAALWRRVSLWILARRDSSSLSIKMPSRGTLLALAVCVLAAATAWWGQAWFSGPGPDVLLTSKALGSEVRITGRTSSAVDSFWGIPYAAPREYYPIVSPGSM